MSIDLIQIADELHGIPDNEAKISFPCPTHGAFAASISLTGPEKLEATCADGCETKALWRGLVKESATLARLWAERKSKGGDANAGVQPQPSDNARAAGVTAGGSANESQEKGEKAKAGASGPEADVKHNPSQVPPPRPETQQKRLDQNPQIPLRDTALEPIFRRVPPQDALSEQSLLGAIMLDPAAIDRAMQIITPNDFYRDSNREIYKAMTAIAAAGKLARDPEAPIDLTSLESELKKRGTFEAVGGVKYLIEIESATPTSLHLDHWARLIREAAGKREYIRAAHAAMEHAYNGSTLPELREYAQKLIPVTTDQAGVDKPLPVPQGAAAWFTEEEERFANVTFLWDGILEAGGISIITGKKGNGKSTFVRTLALSIARGVSVLNRATTMSRVWYVDLEPGGRGRIDVWRNLGWCDDDAMDLTTIPPVAGRDGVFDWLKENIVNRGYKVVVIDTMFKLLRIDGANEYDKGLYAQVPLEEIARDTGVHFILVHHARKNAISEAQSVAEVILGATSIAGAACACILINRRRDKFTFRMDPPRYGQAIEGETLLTLDGTGAVVPGGSWKASWAKASKDTVLELALARINIGQGDSKGWFGARDLDATDETTGEKMKLRTIQWALNALVDDGKLAQRPRPDHHKRGPAPMEYRFKLDIEVPPARSS